MFVNEPFEGQTPNCRLRFPTFKAVTPETLLVGKYAERFIQTIRKGRQGEVLAWCYGCAYERDSPTPCANAC